ncbi:hypothetical protein [Xanthomonas phage RTH11]|nr:hypothetical protein [Xanthomonas phage RTH11]
MSSFELHRAHAQQLLARKSEQLRKERLAREKAKRQAQHIPMGWEDYYQIWLVVALLAGFFINSPWGFALLFHDPVALRVVNLFLLGLLVVVAVIDIFAREMSPVFYHEEEAAPCTTDSELSGASSGTSSPVSSGESQPSSAWRGSWEAGTKRDSPHEASPAV